MSESLPLDQCVARQLASGRYQSKEELVKAGLCLLQEQEEFDHIVEEIRPALRDYLGGNRGTEIDIEAIKAAGRRGLQVATMNSASYDDDIPRW